MQAVTPENGRPSFKPSLQSGALDSVWHWGGGKRSVLCLSCQCIRTSHARLNRNKPGCCRPGGPAACTKEPRESPGPGTYPWLCPPEQQKHRPQVRNQKSLSPLSSVLFIGSLPPQDVPPATWTCVAFCCGRTCSHWSTYSTSIQRRTKRHISQGLCLDRHRCGCGKDNESSFFKPSTTPWVFVLTDCAQHERTLSIQSSSQHHYAIKVL